MTNGTSPGKAMIVLGGVGGIIWLVGAILAAILGGIGQIILGIGVLLTSFVGIGFWQKAKDVMAILTFVFALVGGVLLLVGGALGLVVTLRGVGGIVAGVGQVLFAVALIILGLIINKLGSQLNTQSKLGMDLVFPAVATSMAGGCAALGAAVSVTIPAALILAVMFFVTK